MTMLRLDIIVTVKMDGHNLLLLLLSIIVMIIMTFLHFFPVSSPTALLTTHVAVKQQAHRHSLNPRNPNPPFTIHVCGLTVEEVCATVHHHSLTHATATRVSTTSSTPPLSHATKIVQLGRTARSLASTSSTPPTPAIHQVAPM